MVARWLLLIGFLLVVATSFAQTVTEIRTGMSHREVVAGTDGCTNPPFCHYYEGFVSWNDDQIKELAYRGHQGTITGPVVEFLNCRIVYPAGYDSTRAEKYPMIVMLHGAGESGRIWTGRYDYPNTDARYDNNGANIIHGGQAHLNAVNRSPNLSNAFPGIVLWPQASYNGAWENGWDGGNLNPTGNMVTKVIEWLLENKNIDPDRVYTHGLSNGAKGAWDLPAKRPDLFAAMLPMSGVGSDMAQMAPILKTMPIWLFQGGTDTNPRPQAAVDAIAALQAIGGDPRYTLYPTLGHGTWNTAYAEPDFFPWILSKNKKNIFVRGGDPSICPGGSLELGFSANMAAYQWFRNDTLLTGATGRYYSATKVGIYKVRYQRNFVPKGETPNQWIDSNPLPVTSKTSSSFTPILTNTGSTYLPILKSGSSYNPGPPSTGGMGNDNRIAFTADAGYEEYYWYKKVGLAAPVLAQTTGNNINTRTISSNAGYATDEGEYTVKVKLASGCISDFSNAILVRWTNPQPTSPQPDRPIMTATSSTEATITWPDLVNEAGYEVWRLRYTNPPIVGTDYSFEGWSLIKVLPANTISFKDSGLRPQATYRYIVRALQANGGATFSEEPYVVMTTQQDQTPPSTPTNLVASNITDTSVTLNWDISTDNDRVYKYEIFNGSNLIGTVTGGFEALTAPLTTFVVSNLEPNTINLLNVRAVDWRGNYSPFADGVWVSTQKFVAGLDYRYYQLSGSTLPPLSAFNFNSEPTRMGQTILTGNNNYFTPSNSNIGSVTSPFIVSFEGFIRIQTPGTYGFGTSSNDGSVLYIDNDYTGYKLVVTNDGTRSSAQNSSEVQVTFLTVGYYPIKVNYSSIGSGSSLTLRWRTPGASSITSIPTATASNPIFRKEKTVYYLKTGAPNPSLTSSWNTSSTGIGGSDATTFNNPQTYFVVANNASVTLSSPLSITGSGSKLIVGNGSSTQVILNLNEVLTATVEANQAAVINVNHSTLPKFGLLHPTSTVNFNLAGPVAIPNAMFGNVVLNPAQYNLPQSMTTVQGNLTLQNGVTTTGAPTNLSTLRVGGNLTINNTSGNPFPATGANQYALAFTGGTTHMVSFVNPVNPNLFSIQADFGDVVNFTNLSGNTVTVGSAQGGGLTLKGGAKLNLGNNHLVVTGRGTINNNNETGALSMKGGDLTLTTTATQNNSLYFSAGDSVRNVTLATPAANRAAILTALKVNNLVSVTSGELNAGEGYLVLRSLSDNGTGTARIGPLLNGAKVTGKINAQRYMSGEGRIYRYISSPVKGVTAAALQQYFPITGNFTGSSTGPGLSGNASMYRYTEPNYIQFPAVGGTNLDTLQRGKGYTPFIREATAPTVMSLVGEPYQGTIPFTLTGGTLPTNGWNLLGNPYAAPIKWTGSSTGGWTMSGVNNTVYIRENYNNTFTWKSFDGTTGSFDGVIAPGQAFWVRTTTTSPVISVGESAKQALDGAFYREGWPDNVLEVVMKNNTAQDATYIRWVDGATPAFDTNLDGVKQDNSYFNLSSLSEDNKALVINQTTTNYCEQEIKLRTANAPIGSYELNINGSSSIISGDEVTLVDNFTQTQKIISDSEVYAFSITSDPASKADARFILRFKKPAVVLNQTLKSDAACEQGSPVIMVNNSQPGVTYQAYHNGLAISEARTSVGEALQLTIDPMLVSYGSTVATVQAGFKGCNNFELPMTIAVQRDTLPMPEIIEEPLRLLASPENASYQWYLNGEELDGQTGRELLAPVNGLYFVEVTLGSCSKKSDTISYVVTALEKQVRASQVYPNPTRDKIIVTLEQPINFSTLRVLSTVGQVLAAPNTRLSAESAEIDFAQLPVGLYVLQVNGQTYRVLKE